MRHLLDTTDLSLEEIDTMIATAMDIIENKDKYAHKAENKADSQIDAGFFHQRAPGAADDGTDGKCCGGGTGIAVHTLSPLCVFLDEKQLMKKSIMEEERACQQL